MRKYKLIEFQFDPEMERATWRLRKEQKDLKVAITMDDLQDMGNLNPRGEIQLVNEPGGQNGPPGNNIIHMADDRDRVIRDYAMLTPQVINLGIVRLEVQADNFELKPMMFQMLRIVGQFNGLPFEDFHILLKLFLEVSDAFNIDEALQEAL